MPDGRWHRNRKGVLTYYMELKITGHKRHLWLHFMAVATCVGGACVHLKLEGDGTCLRQTARSTLTEE